MKWAADEDHGIYREDPLTTATGELLCKALCNHKSQTHTSQDLGTMFCSLQYTSKFQNFTPNAPFTCWIPLCDFHVNITILHRYAASTYFKVTKYSITIENQISGIGRNSGTRQRTAEMLQQSFLLHKRWINPKIKHAFNQKCLDQFLIRIVPQKSIHCIYQTTHQFNEKWKMMKEAQK